MIDSKPGPYDALLDAEWAATDKPSTIHLIKALRQASGLGLAPAKNVVEDYLSRKMGGPGKHISPSAVLPATVLRDRAWIDDFIDAERDAALREGRELSKIDLIKSIRESASFSLKDAKAAVDDYFYRRGGHPPRTAIPNTVKAVLFLLLLLALFLAWKFI